MQRYHFNEIFNITDDGAITPKRKIRISGIEFGPGVSFGPGVAFGGIDFHKYKNLDIAAEEIGDVLEIRGFFKDIDMARQVFDSDLKQLVSLDQAIADSVFNKEFAQLKADLKEQKSISWQIIIGVCVAFIFTVGLAVIEITLSHKNDLYELVGLQRDFYSKIDDLSISQNQINQTTIQKFNSIQPYCFKK